MPGGDPAALLTASATLAFLVGIMLILASVMRLGVVDSALKTLIEIEEQLCKRGGLLCLVALNPEVLGRVQRSSLGETLGRERMLFNLPKTVGGYLAPERRPDSRQLDADQAIVVPFV